MTMNVTKPIVLAALLLTGGCAADGARVRAGTEGVTPAQRYVEVEVPIAPPRFVIEGVPYRDPEQIGPPLILRLPLAPDGSDEKPADIDALVHLLWAAMPPDYRRALAADFGFSIDGRAGGPSRPLRSLDVAKFVFDRYALGDTSTRLGKQFDCVSWGEWEFVAIFALIAHEEVRSDERYVRRADIPGDVNVNYPAMIAQRLVHICRGEPDDPQG